jgi:methylenetetrahydrofolate reductase (NADPH)
MIETDSSGPGIAELLRGYSVEVNPSQFKAVETAPDRLESGTEVFLPWIPGADPMDTVAPAARLRRAGLIPVPHIGARHIESAAQLEQFAARLASEGIDRVLIIGGDRAKPAGPYDSSLQVLQAEGFQKSGFVRIAVAGFPEGNPNIPEIALEEALIEKTRFAQSCGLQLSIVTQFCFEAAPIVAWLRHIRARGILVPVRIGLAGPAGLLTLARYAVRCGIGNSLHVLTQNPAFARLLVEKGPEPIIRGIAASDGLGRATAGNHQPDSLGIAGLHFYVFGGFDKTIDWITAQRRLRSPSTHP